MDAEELVTALHERYSDMLYHRIRGITHDDEAARDIVQETFIKLWRRTADLINSSDGERRSWLYTTAIRAAIDLYRHRVVLRMCPLDGFDQAVYDDNLEALIEDDARAYDTARCLEAVEAIQHPRRRLAMLLAYKHGATMQQIAEFTGTTLLTVKALLYRGRIDARRNFYLGKS